MKYVRKSAQPMRTKMRRRCKPWLVLCCRFIRCLLEINSARFTDIDNILTDDSLSKTAVKQLIRYTEQHLIIKRSMGPQKADCPRQLRAAAY